MGADAVTILLADEGSMRRAAQCAQDWMRAQPDHMPGTEYAFLVGDAPDGRIALTGVPVESLPGVLRAGVAFEVQPDS